MARKPEVFVRELDPGEAQKLVRICRTSKNGGRLRRAGIVLASLQGRSAGEIADLWAAKDQTVREVIKAFNEHGFAALDPKERRASRPVNRTSEHVREQVCRVAKTPPQRLGQPFTRWSLSKLADYLRQYERISLSRQTIRLVLKHAGISWQATKTWKASTDPDFTSKKNRILSLYDAPPADGRVICVDEFGPLNLQPRPGRGWFPRGQPARVRATYRRTHGVRHMFAALDLATGQMFWRIRERKRWQEFLDFCKQLRRRYPTGKLYMILDNYGPHKKPQVTTWCRQNNIELVYTPSNASWLNWIEAEFTALRAFTLDGSDYPNHHAQQTAIAHYLRWRNKRAQPKRHFAIGSKIRQPDYLPYAA